MENDDVVVGVYVVLPAAATTFGQAPRCGAIIGTKDNDATGPDAIGVQRVYRDDVVVPPLPVVWGICAITPGKQARAQSRGRIADPSCPCRTPIRGSKHGQETVLVRADLKTGGKS